MTPPKRVRVLGHSLRVEFVASIDDGESAGAIDYETGRVLIDSNQPLDERRSTLLHEMIHGVSDGMGLEWEEDKVQEVERVIFALLRDNPTAVRWMLSKG